MNASSISRILKKGGLNPLPSGTPIVREGIRVKGGSRHSQTISIVVDVEVPSLRRQLVDNVAEILTESGITFTQNENRFTIARATPPADQKGK